MRHITTTGTAAALIAAVALLVSACGGNGGGGSSNAASPEGPTVSVDKVAGVGDVLVDRSGAALYAAEQEANGHVVCTGSCTTIWQPLTLDGSKAPTGESVVASKLGTIMRPGGGRQVTFAGRPLYRFAEDPDSGTVTGNGFDDTFDGRAFEWHVATSEGVSTTSANSSTSSPGY